MKTPEEFAHEQTEYWQGVGCQLTTRHLSRCLMLTSAVMARDEEHSNKLAVALEALRILLKKSKDPMRSWDAGRCLEAEQVEYICEEAIDKIKEMS